MLQNLSSAAVVIGALRVNSGTVAEDWKKTNIVLIFKKGVKHQAGNYQELSQNAEKVTHIKERLPDQAVILFNCVPYQNGNFS